MPTDWGLFVDGDLPAWFAEAACRDVHTDVFFPEKGATTTAARDICRQCRVQTLCLAYALEHDERNGIWGGTTPRERSRLKAVA